jgi:hypothetical protein
MHNSAAAAQQTYNASDRQDECVRFNNLLVLLSLSDKHTVTPPQPTQSVRLTIIPNKGGAGIATLTSLRLFT